MFSKKNELSKNNGSSILHKHIKVRGNITVNSQLCLDCPITGNITSKTDGVLLVIGPHGEIIGNISVPKIEVYGSIKGDITCTSIKVYAKAQINGNISYQNIEIEPDSKIEGEITSSKNSDAPYNKPIEEQKKPSSNVTTPASSAKS